LVAAIIEDNQDKFILIAGDFNSALVRRRWYDNLLNDFITEHELDCYDLIFGNELKATYRNGHYRCHIDHSCENNAENRNAEMQKIFFLHN
jgi:hypothetical protein